MSLTNVLAYFGDRKKFYRLNSWLSFRQSCSFSRCHDKKLVTERERKQTKNEIIFCQKNSDIVHFCDKKWKIILNSFKSKWRLTKWPFTKSLKEWPLPWPHSARPAWEDREKSYKIISSSLMLRHNKLERLSLARTESIACGTRLKSLAFWLYLSFFRREGPYSHFIFFIIYQWVQ